ncbi:AMP-binding protein [Yinghuangia seranimata]|uniref:AMP-binding protein n=1 Tax=Yinghuangia seranimata TaxID=408067 RepID=UPI00248B1809|nr:AMP-binding protein [Yinghuangia seranimata]MDI2132105.1 AMP-binding protein [Yinghuangia seranimata]
MPTPAPDHPSPPTARFAPAPLCAATPEGLPDHPDALVVDGRATDRAALLAAAAAVAQDVRGLPAVAVRATASLETVAAVLGGLQAGVPVVPVPPDSGPLERAHILRDSGAAALLDPGFGPATPGAWADTGVPTLPIDLARQAGTSFPAPASDTVALILYTSGTTGAPKGVLTTHGAVAADLDALATAWDWSADDVLVHGLPLFHIHGLVLGVLGALRTGSRLVHTGRPTAERYAAAAEQHGGSLFFGVPTVWSRIADEPAAARALRGARLLVSGSAPLPAPVFARVAELTGHHPVERYGMTETLITVSTRADGERPPGTVGHPLDGITTRLAAEDGTPVPADGRTIGELQVSGPTLFAGYLNRPDATAAALTPDGWFRTGDLATVDPDGRHRIVGRAATDLIKSGGFRIGAGEVEDALLSHPAVREAAVVGVPHADLGQEIVAFVVAEPAVTDRELTDFVAAGLSVHKRPRRVVRVDALPRNALGKVQKKQLSTDA